MAFHNMISSWLTFPNRRGEDSLVTPAHTPAAFNIGLRDAGSSGPLRLGFGDLVKCHLYRIAACALILQLLFVSGPPDVAWFVIAVVIGVPIYRVFWAGARAYVSNKPPKIVSPFWAHRDTATAPILEVLKPRVVAPGFHVLPAVIFWLFSLVYTVLRHGALLLGRQVSGAGVQAPVLRV